jgi:hypothetical protein
LYNNQASFLDISIATIISITAIENTLPLSDKILVSKIIATNEFTSFIDAAKRYCSFIESHEAETARHFILQSQNHLLSLYNLGNCMILMEEKSDQKIEVKLDELEFQRSLHFIADRLWDYRYYWYVFDPTAKKKDAGIVYGDLYEDLGAIYKYLKQTLLLYGMKSSEAKQNAVWDFKWNFDTHWSGHCANAICAIHYFLQKSR